MVFVKQSEEENNDKRTSMSCRHWNEVDIEGIMSGIILMKLFDILLWLARIPGHSTKNNREKRYRVKLY